MDALREEILNIKNTVDGFKHSIKEVEEFKDMVKGKFGHVPFYFFNTTYLFFMNFNIM